MGLFEILNFSNVFISSISCWLAAVIWASSAQLSFSSCEVGLIFSRLFSFFFFILLLASTLQCSQKGSDKDSGKNVEAVRQGRNHLFSAQQVSMSVWRWTSLAKFLQPVTLAVGSFTSAPQPSPICPSHISVFYYLLLAFRNWTQIVLYA